MTIGRTPHASDFAISFKLTDENLNDWLHALPAEDHFHSCKQILAVLEESLPTRLDLPERINFLDKISRKTDLLVEQIEKAYLDTGAPLDPGEIENSELVTRSYAILARRYQDLGEDMLKPASRVDDRAKAVVLYSSMLALGKTLLHASMVYRQPFDGFWLQSYQIYKMAESANLLGMKITTADFSEGTISSAFKHMLLFELSVSFQFRPRDMKRIFHLLQHHAAASIIETDYSQESVQQLCSFNLKMDKPPKMLFAQAPAKDSENRFISPTLTAKNLHQVLQNISSAQNVLKSINESVFSRAIRSLSLSQRRKYGRNKEHLEKNCIVGFHQVASYLYKLKHGGHDECFEKLKNDPRIAGNWHAPDFDLIPMDDDASYQLDSLLKSKQTENANIVKILKTGRDYSSVDKVWKPNDMDKIKRFSQIPYGEFEIIDSSANGMQALWKSSDVKVKVGEIIAIPSCQGDKVQIGLIRRIHVSKDNETRLGIEMIGNDSLLVALIKLDRAKQPYIAIFLPGITALKQADTILYQTSDLVMGEFVNILKGPERSTCRLQKVVNSTAAITHMELHYTSEEL